jgi:hypothetical protein
MQFADASLQGALQAKWQQPTADEWAGAHNVAFEERVSQARQDDYESYLEASDLADTHNCYVTQNVRIRGRLGATFAANNQTAQVSPPQNLELVRIESAGRAIEEYYDLTGQPGCDRLNQDIETFNAPGNSGSAPGQRLEEFLEQLQNNRDCRPVFASPLADVRTIADQQAWAQDLAVRLGIDFAPDKAYPNPPILLQVRYTVADIYDLVAQPPSPFFTAPTAIDAPWNEHFFPSPDARLNSAKIWGRTLDLDNTTDTTTPPCREILHPPFCFAPRHLVSAQCFDPTVRPAADQDPKAVRNMHLYRLRNTTGHHNFGWPC